MIKLVMHNLGKNSPRCPDACVNKHPLNKCPNGCTQSIRTAFTCPYCGVVRCFYGGNCPNICTGCQKKLPDMYIMKSDIVSKGRIEYHAGVF